MVAAVNLASGGLDDRAWAGRKSLVDSVSATASSLSGTEIALIVLTVVFGVLALAGWGLAGLLWFRGSRPTEGLLPSIPMPTLWSEGVTGSTDPERAALAAEKEELVQAEREDMSYLHMDNASYRKKWDAAAQRRAEIDAKIDTLPDVPED